MTSPSASAPAPRIVRNLLFIMCDQLRADVMSVCGGPVPTPNIARLAARGVRFDKAFVNAGVCGPSRTSFYTGRYPVSHRVTWNRVPMPVDELTLGHYLMDAGLPLHLLGKTHFVPDTRAAAHLGYQVDTAIRAVASRPVVPKPHVGELVRRRRHQSVPEERFELLAANLLVRIGISEDLEELLQRRHT